MKKILITLLAILVLSASLVACDGDKDTADTSDAAQTTAAQTTAAQNNDNNDPTGGDKTENTDQTPDKDWTNNY